jgi:hypothetical protein
MAGVWWLSLAAPYTSYDEVKRRKVVAQGWPLLGDLSELVPLVGHNWRRFEAGIIAANHRISPLDWAKSARLGEALEDQDHRAPKALWLFFQIQAGDLVVALEGTRVRGICEVRGDYWYDADHHFAQCLGRDIHWVDWDRAVLGPPPPHPPRRLLGVAQVGKDRDWICQAWARWQRSRRLEL